MSFWLERGLAIPELAEFLGVTTAEIRSWIARGRIPAPHSVRRVYGHHYDAWEVLLIEDWYSDCLKREAEGRDLCEPLRF